MASQEGVFTEEEQAEKLIGENNLKKLRDTHFTAGVREGISAGKECALQDGFNCGYQEAFLKSHIIGKLRGVLSAVLSHVNSRSESGKSNQEDQEKIRALLSDLTDIEVKQIEQMKACLKDGEIPRGNEQTCSSDSTDSQEQKAEHSLSNAQLTDLWNKCRHFCNEFGIDIPTIQI